MLLDDDRPSVFALESSSSVLSKLHPQFRVVQEGLDLTCQIERIPRFGEQACMPIRNGVVQTADPTCNDGNPGSHGLDRSPPQRLLRDSGKHKHIR